MPTVLLVPIYLPDRQVVLDELAAGLASTLALESESRTPWFDPEPAFDPSRGQYHSTRLLELLLTEPEGRGDVVLGVSGVDLFIPILTYVFGEAQLGGRAAVVSLERLRPEAYGLPADSRKVRERLLKEALHELGHVFGLLHCESPACAMRASTYAEDIDLKPGRYCEPCAARAAASWPPFAR